MSEMAGRKVVSGADGLMDRQICSFRLNMSGHRAPF